jgi:hypothetical protein
MKNEQKIIRELRAENLRLRRKVLQLRAHSAILLMHPDGGAAQKILSGAYKEYSLVSFSKN